MRYIFDTSCLPEIGIIGQKEGQKSLKTNKMNRLPTNQRFEKLQEKLKELSLTKDNL